MRKSLLQQVKQRETQPTVSRYRLARGGSETSETHLYEGVSLFRVSRALPWPSTQNADCIQLAVANELATASTIVTCAQAKNGRA
jgi:hypothetical protein